MGDHTMGYTSAMSVPELNTFPAELQLQVISHLPAQDIYSFKMTCRHYRDLIDEYLTSVTSLGIQRSLSRLRLSIERCCGFPVPGEHHRLDDLQLYIDAFTTFRDEIHFEYHRIASRQFAAYYAHRTKMPASYTQALIRLSDDYSTRTDWRPDPTYNPSGDPRFRLVPKTFYRFNLIEHADRIMYPQARETMHNKLAAVLGVPLTPSHSPLAFYARTQWAQHVVFAAYMGKPIDPLRHAAVLEQTFLGHLRGPDQVAFYEVIGWPL